jgi:probable F420-dependent oxidoreductase
VSLRIEAALPFWLDRPDEDALQIAGEVDRAGLRTLWIGQLATYDAIALATAIGIRSPGLTLKLGPLAIGERSPAAIAFGASSVAALTGSQVDVALGASSPAIVSGWHGRDWAHSAPRMRETIECLRIALAGQRTSYEGRYVHSHGFRLRRPMPATRLIVAAFGPAMTRVAARQADEVVLNLVAPERVQAVRAEIDHEARAAGRAPARLAVWVPVAVQPGDAARAQLASQLAVYLAPPGYGEMFSTLGFPDLVRQAREGMGRAELASLIPPELLERVCALGTREQLLARLGSYYEAGADIIAVVPSTAEDPGGRAALGAVSELADAGASLATPA